MGRFWLALLLDVAVVGTSAEAPSYSRWAGSVVAAVTNVTCAAASSNSILVHFDEVEDTDLYYVELYAAPPAPTSPPFRIQTAASSPVLLYDLLPNVDYFLQLRSHVASAPSIVWNWRVPASGDAVQCRTAPQSIVAPVGLTRVAGDFAEAHAVNLEWRIPGPMIQQLNVTSTRTVDFDITLQRIGSHDMALQGQGMYFVEVEEEGVQVGEAQQHTLQRKSVGVTAVQQQAEPTFQVRIEDLQEASTYVATVAVASDEYSSPGAPPPASDTFVFRTLAQGHNFTEILRISEYTTDFDFLPNHDGASFEASSAFLTNTNDDSFFNLNVSSPPVTRYCVEHLLPPTVSHRRIDANSLLSLPSDDFADYVSCNGPEAKPRNNKEDPICICDVFADRMISLQTAAQMGAACGVAPLDPTTHTHGAPDCNCSGSKWNVPAYSDTFIGAATVWEPYFYYQSPKDTYPGTRIGGLWYSAPKKGTCNETQSVGTGDCTWKRHSSADVVYGAQLMALGWNNSVFISGTVLVLCCVLNVS
eukprot:INCI3286.1.p1 GENE.INCI3286.1~~INCI3286.1.p1  ORF type:complete len:530 (-),score=83.09 INCI3286.1:192-1781(-)